jgi:hypothetical protein
LRFVHIVLLTLLAPGAAAQTRHSAGRAAGATVSGVVRDSIARVPLAGAVVQLVAVDGMPRFGRSTTSDSLGRYTLTDIPEGRFQIGFLHAMLDSLGLEPSVREVEVVGSEPVRVDLGTPSPARLREAICGPRTPENPGSAVAGVVRDSRDGSPAGGVDVIGEWIELDFGPSGMRMRTPRLVATTEANGWFALCNVPSPGVVSVMAWRGADSTDLVEVKLTSEDFVRRELYLGPSRTEPVGDTLGRSDSLATPRRFRRGDGHLSGTVVTAQGQPLAGAQVNLLNGPRTRTNERGQWTLLNAPLGTRLLEVRAISYYPDRRAVNVVAGAGPVRVVLLTLKAVLDTVRVTAARLADHGSGFETRRRTMGIGRFLTREDIAKRAVMSTSDLFRTVPGIRVETEIVMKSAFDDCWPSLYIDNNLVSKTDAALTPIDIDAWVRPNEIAGIEIYFDQVPPQFQRALTGCGSIVIWTRK